MPFMAFLLGLGDSYYENLALQTPPLVKCLGNGIEKAFVNTGFTKAEAA
jgi:hypothetical protein